MEVIVGTIGQPVQVWPSDLMRVRLAALRAAQQRSAPDTEPDALPWAGGAVEGELLDGNDTGVWS